MWELFPEGMLHAIADGAKWRRQINFVMTLGMCVGCSAIFLLSVISAHGKYLLAIAQGHRLEPALVSDVVSAESGGAPFNVPVINWRNGSCTRSLTSETSLTLGQQVWVASNNNCTQYTVFISKPSWSVILIHSAIIGVFLSLFVGIMIVLIKAQNLVIDDIVAYVEKRKLENNTE